MKVIKCLSVKQSQNSGMSIPSEFDLHDYLFLTSKFLIYLFRQLDGFGTNSPCDAKKCYKLARKIKIFSVSSIKVDIVGNPIVDDANVAILRRAFTIDIAEK